MNRRKFVSLLSALPFVGGISFASTKPTVKLLPYQQQILDAIKNNKRVLVWLPRGGGKTWLFNKITKEVYPTRCIGIRHSMLGDKHQAYYDEISSFLFNDERERIVVLASPSSNPEHNRRAENMDWDVVLKFTYEDLGVMYNQNLIRQAQQTMPKEQFDREFLCKF